MEEIEVKVRITDIKTVAKRLLEFGFQITVARHRERNYLLDDASRSFQTSGRVLRVRHTPEKQILTFKGPIQTESKLKRREEVECGIEDVAAMLRILEETGFKVRTEYSKNRTVFEKDGFNLSLDETEAGNYLEVEGRSSDEIMDLVGKLGYSEQDFVPRTYAELIGESRK
jgi:predicted adenylyl cyclase CyaB